MIKTVLFDLDGTLLNTIDDLADAGNWVCAQHGWPTFTVEQFKHMVGNGIPKLVERFSPENARTPEQLAATLAEFTARYDAHKEDKTAPYPGIPELLDALPEADRQRPLLAGIFNFGYLPGTDKRCTTTAAGSLAAVDALLERLAPQGCLSLHCYTGHEGGAAEEAALAQRLARLEPRRWRVLHCRDANRETHGESILLAERLPVRQR